jgi:peptide-methionine (S)-S-oxide reductase
MELATFAAGCFWGVEAAFRKIKGVVKTTVGYTGGHFKNPSYQDVCTDQTGHAEAVRVEFDPIQVSYDKLLEVFFAMHDPTTPNRQGWDVGTQYRSAIFYHSHDQKVKALAFKEKLEREKKFQRPIVTEIVPVTTFNDAEAYHQQYYEKKGILKGCHLV